MSHPSDRATIGAPRSVPVTVPSALLTFYLPLAIGLLLLAGVTTQAIALATGRDFVFGLVPKFDPAGTRNIQSWFASVMLAAGAASMLAAAALRLPSRGRIASWLWGGGALLGVLSIDRLTSILGQPQQWLVASSDFESVLFILAGFALVTVGAVSVPRGAGSIGGQVALALAVLLMGILARAAGRADPPLVHDSVARLILTAGGTTLELAAGVLLMRTMLQQVFARGASIVMRVDSHRRSLFTRHELADAVVIHVSPTTLRRAIAVGIAVLLCASFAAAVLRTLGGWEIERVYRLLYVDFEGNLPTWFSSALLFGCAAVASLITAASRHARDLQWRSWALVALLFIGLSADEAASIHELTVTPLRAMVGQNPWLRYPLILPGCLVVAALAILGRRFLAGLPAATRWAFGAGFALLVIGALGVELAGGWFDPVAYGDNLTYIALATLEEGLEMVGVSMVLIGLLRHVEQTVGPLQIGLST